jgi:arylsulfatase
VRDNGIANDTIVVFSSDNGPWIDAWPDAGYSPPRNERDRFLTRAGVFPV